MRKAWKIVTAIVLILILLGAVSVGVGLMTGGDAARVMETVEDRFHPTAYYEYAGEVIQVFKDAFLSPAA